MPKRYVDDLLKEGTVGELLEKLQGVPLEAVLIVVEVNTGNSPQLWYENGDTETRLL